MVQFVLSQIIRRYFLNKNFLVKLLSGICALTITLSLAPPALAMFPQGNSLSSQYFFPPKTYSTQKTPVNNNFYLGPGIYFGGLPQQNSNNQLPDRTDADNSTLDCQKITNLNIQPTSPTNQNHQQPYQEVKEEIDLGNNFLSEDDEEFNN